VLLNKEAVKPLLQSPPWMEVN